MAPQDPRRFCALDGLRGIAALLVVLLHVGWSNHLTNNAFVSNGYLAVDLFFILSGFVLSSNYLDRIKSPSDVRRFIVLRFFRLYPLHAAILLAFVALEGAKVIAQEGFAIAPGPQPPFTGSMSVDSLVANILLVQGLPLAGEPSWNGASWSISCEFVAYLVFSAAVVTGVTQRENFYRVGMVLAAAGYAVIALNAESLNVTVDLGIVRCLAGFFLGMLIFRWTTRYEFRSRTLASRCEIVAIAVALLCMAVSSGALAVLVIVPFVAVIAMLQSDQGPAARVLMTAPAQFLGRISYSIYMVHSLVVVSLLIVLKRVAGLPMGVHPLTQLPIVLMDPWVGDLLVLAVIAAVIVTAWATYELIEEPGRLFGRRRAAQPKTVHPGIVVPRIAE